MSSWHVVRIYEVLNQIFVFIYNIYYISQLAFAFIESAQLASEKHTYHNDL